MGKLDCDKDPKTGCEVEPTTNVDHCGGCGMGCTTPNGTMACMDSMCSFVACNANFDDCTPAAGCETDLLSDPHHCTACGKSCNGGACKAGVCNPPILVAKIPFAPSKFAIFKDVIYVGSRSSTGDFASVSIAGGNPLLIGSTPGFTNAVEVNTDGIFVAASQGAIRMNLDGSNKFNYGSNNQSSRGIGTTGNDVYWTTLNTIKKGQIMFGLPITLWSGITTANGLFITPNAIMYWTLNDGAIWSSPTADFAPKQISIGPPTANNIFADLKNVYWSSAKGIHWSPISGGNSIELASSTAVRSVAIDATHLYWTDETAGLVQRIVKDGSAPAEVLALDQAGPYGLALDSQFVYWSDSTSSEIWKLPK